MIQIAFTTQAINELAYERYHYPDPKAQKRIDVLHLKSLGKPHNQIREICGISGPTLAKYLKLYRDGGIEALKTFHYKGHRSELENHVSTLKEWFTDHPPHTVAEAQREIERITGIRRSPTQVRQFLKRIGMKMRKVGAVPGKSMDENKLREQEDFERDKLRPRLEEAAAGERSLFFP